jgi:RHS repeat-associated protein
MALSVTYTTINGRIVYENRSGTESFYAPDTLDSTSALVSSSGTITDSYTYWPYGETRNHTGSAVTPFTFVGALGYYTDQTTSRIYIRARYLRQALVSWLTLDSLWPNEWAYAYADSNPITNVDADGLGCGQKKPPQHGWWPPSWWPWQPQKPGKPKPKPKPRPKPKPKPIPPKSTGPEKLCDLQCGLLCPFPGLAGKACEAACKKWCHDNYGPGTHPIPGLPNYQFCWTRDSDECDQCCHGGCDGLSTAAQQGMCLQHCLAGCSPM